MKNTKVQSSWGIGSSSVIIALLAMVFSFNVLMGDFKNTSINALGVSFPPEFIAIIFFLISLFIGSKFKEHKGADIGRNLSLFAITIIMFFSVVNAIV